MEISRFTEKLNRVEGNVYRIEERAVLQGGTYEGELAHDNVDPETLSVYTGPKLTGEKVNSYSLSVPAMAPWKHIILVYADAPEVYISYSTEGDMVEADDVNRLQDAVVAAQEAVNAEAAVREGLALEVERAAEADQALRDALAAEVKRAMDAEALLAGNTGGSGEGGSISFIEQTTVSTEDGGVNVWTMQLSDGTRRDFEVRNGTRGRDGVDGMDGAPGKDGVDGRDGAPGPAGNDGAPGRNGTDGVPGPAGSDGFSPTITENSGNSSEVYKLDITTKSGKITTPNLKGADGKDSTRTEEILEMFGGLKFSQDADGNWGYISPGGDAVIPFGGIGGALKLNEWYQVSGEMVYEKNTADFWVSTGDGILSQLSGAWAISVDTEVQAAISIKVDAGVSGSVYLNGTSIFSLSSSYGAALTSEPVTLVKGTNNLVVNAYAKASTLTTKHFYVFLPVIASL
jgi:hypothetical protein